MSACFIVGLVCDPFTEEGDEFGSWPLALINDRIDAVEDKGDAGADGKCEDEAPCGRCEWLLCGRIFLGCSTFPGDETFCPPPPPPPPPAATTDDAIIDFCCCCCLASSMASFSSAAIWVSDRAITSRPNPATRTCVLTLGGVPPRGVEGSDFSLLTPADNVLWACWCFAFLAAWFT